MRVYDLYLKDEYTNEIMLDLLSDIFELDPKQIVIAEEFVGDEMMDGKSLLCIMNSVSGEFGTNIVLCAYKEELCGFSDRQLSKIFAALTFSSCLISKETENPYLYAVVEFNSEYDVLVDDSLLEENGHINILKTL